MINDQKMDQRITVRLTDDELNAAERAAIAEGDRKISTLIRRALLVFLRDRGYTNFSANPAHTPFTPGYQNPTSPVQQPATHANPQYGAAAPQYSQPNTLA
ncbi:MAG: hypothetical protein CAK90_07690 [Spartobacteria bacterium AMD-G4]|jgi:hypothetical protein|nr:MAG: hypothetical protein CAK90_07690 [Spartobacteria bacterium AMD-G4]HBE23413.1 hypothetical protein [Verrucomicrobiales bacterium]